MPRVFGRKSILHVRLWARAVEAAGANFSPTDTVFHDVGVALDEISSLTGNVEPVVLRVRAVGGAAADRAAVHGDWLCADHDPPRRLRRPEWTVSAEASVWSAQREWVEAWEGCSDARWMLHEVAAVGLDRRLLALAACACAATSLRFARGDGGRTARLIEVTEAWARGAAEADEVLRLSDAALADGYPGAVIGRHGAAAFAARSAGFAAEVAADPGAAALAAVSAANAISAFAADDLARGPGDPGAATAFERHVASMAPVVRERIPTIAVLRAAMLPPPA